VRHGRLLLSNVWSGDDGAAGGRLDDTEARARRYSSVPTRRRYRLGLAVGGLAVGGLAVGGLAVGGLAVGALAVGGLAVGGLAVGGLAVGGLASGASRLTTQLSLARLAELRMITTDSMPNGSPVEVKITRLSSPDMLHPKRAA
jgi:hypothetical protein